MAELVRLDVIGVVTAGIGVAMTVLVGLHLAAVILVRRLDVLAALLVRHFGSSLLDAAFAEGRTHDVRRRGNLPTDRLQNTSSMRKLAGWTG